MARRGRSAPRAAPRPEPQPFELRVHGLDEQGRGLGRSGAGPMGGGADGVEWAVEGAFPGERCRVEALAVSRHGPRGFARLLEVLEPAPGRRAAPCPRHPARGGACTGCPLMELEVTAQREAKRARLAALGLAVPPLTDGGPELGYRWSSKRTAFAAAPARAADAAAGAPNGAVTRAVDGAAPAGALFLGSHRRGSHQGADMTGCQVDHPLLTAAADALAGHARRLGLEPWDEARGTGDLRHVWLRTDGQAVLVTLVTAARESRAARELAPLLAVDGVAQSVHPGRGNAQRGDAPRLLAGRATLDVTLAGEAGSAGFLGFLQPNPSVASRAYLALVSTPEGTPQAGSLALDLYAGAGATTALLRRRFTEVVPCESFPESAAALGVEPLTAAAFLDRLVADAAHPWRRAALVTANPPRAGLGPEVCAALVALAFPRLTLMSCGPEALARDLALLEAGGYRRLGARAWDTLPQTAHVEVVAWLGWSGAASPA